jgi:maltose alpha-D-glucosyltransferase/alpha-amylase
VADPHDCLRDIRDFSMRRRGDSMLLAEANEPLDRLPAFFGESGNQMHMLFNFIVNQSLYLAFVRGSAAPVADALRSLPPIPPESQWANFIKNHDEASLDKLSEQEREEVFEAFAPKESMRLFGRGIRRRFPTMVNGDRRRLEHAYSLLFSLPGTPVLFYGEEIGMGDDQRLAGREAVRLPMQWSAQRGGGFTTADESKAPRRPMRDGPWGYKSLNVEAQREDPGSLLNWMERAIRTRKEWPEFGWGAWRVLGTRNPAALAHIATWDGRSALAVHNFGDAPAKVSLRLPADAVGGRWRQIFGSAEDEPPGARSDQLSFELEPYGYRWFGRRQGV